MQARAARDAPPRRRAPGALAGAAAEAAAAEEKEIAQEEAINKAITDTRKEINAFEGSFDEKEKYSIEMIKKQHKYKTLLEKRKEFVKEPNKDKKIKDIDSSINNIEKAITDLNLDLQEALKEKQTWKDWKKLGDTTLGGSIDTLIENAFSDDLINMAFNQDNM